MGKADDAEGGPDMKDEMKQEPDYACMVRVRPGRDPVSGKKIRNTYNRYEEGQGLIKKMNVA